MSVRGGVDKPDQEARAGLPGEQTMVPRLKGGGLEQWRRNSIAGP